MFARAGGVHPIAGKPGFPYNPRNPSGRFDLGLKFKQHHPRKILEAKPKKLMKPSHTFRAIPFVTVGLFGLGLSGCIATQSSNVNIAGKTIPDDVYTQIQPGKDKDFVVGLIGEPFKKITEDNGTEVWRWNYVETKTAARTILILYVEVHRTNTTQTVAVEFKGGVVTKIWRE
jgi:outer membrane protein assembly factor BamE (lipoprotein component of BamABCDE complex)